MWNLPVVWWARSLICIWTVGCWSLITLWASHCHFPTGDLRYQKFPVAHTSPCYRVALWGKGFWFRLWWHFPFPMSSLGMQPNSWDMLHCIITFYSSLNNRFLLFILYFVCLLSFWSSRTSIVYANPFHLFIILVDWFAFSFSVLYQMC